MATIYDYLLNPVSQLGLLSDKASQSAQDYLAPDLYSGRSRPFTTTRPMGLTNRQRIELNKAAESGYRSQIRDDARMRQSGLNIPQRDAFQPIRAGTQVNPNSLLQSEQGDRVPFFQDVASVGGPVAEAFNVGANLFNKYITDPTIGYFAGAEPRYQEGDTTFDFTNESQASGNEVSSSLSGKGGLVDRAITSAGGLVDTTIGGLSQAKDLLVADFEEKKKIAVDEYRATLREDERLRNLGANIPRKDNSLFEEAKKQTKSTVAKAWKAFTSSQNLDPDGNPIETPVENPVEVIAENKKAIEEITNSTLSENEKETKVKELTDANNETAVKTLDKAKSLFGTGKKGKIKDMMYDDGIIMALSLISSSQKGEDTATGLLNALTAVKEANETSTERLVTLTNQQGQQVSLRLDDPRVDSYIEGGYTVRPMTPFDTLTAGYGLNMGVSGGQQADPEAVAAIMNANEGLTRADAERAAIENGNVI